MKYIKLAEQLTRLPEGVVLENSRLRTTAIVALAASLCVPMTGNDLNAAAQEDFFYNNAEALRRELFEINEVTPYNVDRAIEVAGKVWRKRYNLAYNPWPAQLLSPVDLVGEFLPEIHPETGAGLFITIDDITAAVGALRDALAA